MWHSERSVRAPSVPDAAIPEPPVSQSPSDSEHVDLEDPAMNTYALVKQRHELTCFKLITPKVYIHILPDGAGIDILKFADVKTFFTNVFFFERRANGTYSPKKFIHKWTDDPSIRTLNGMVVDPTGSLPNVYNLWKPFKAQLLPAVPEADVHELVQPMIQHIQEVITNNNTAHTDFILDYLANMVQHPERKSQVAISLFGEQGCGKGILFDHFRAEVLGPFSSFQTAKPEQTLFAKHANGFVNRICIQIDEVKCLHDHNDALKNIITCDMLQFEDKNKPIINIANLTNLILTSNNEDALMIPPDDRRFVLFSCSSKYVGNYEHFRIMSNQLRRPEVARAIYQYLMARDLSKYTTNFQEFRPVTDFYKETRLACIPVVFRFLSALTEDAFLVDYTARILYRNLSQFCAVGNHKYIITETAFGRELRKIGPDNGIEKKKAGNGCMVYHMDKAAFKEYLQRTKRYDPDAEWKYEDPNTV